MIRTMLTVVVMVSTSLAMGQCKYSTNTPQEKTTKRAWIQSDMAGGHGLLFSKVNDVYKLKCYKSITGIVSLFTSTDDRLRLGLESGDTLVFKNTVTRKTTIIRNGTMSVSHVTGEYDITKDELTLLSEHKIIWYKFETQDNYQSGVTNKKKGLKNVMSNAKCILDL